MHELLNELAKCLEEKQKEELQRASECSDFEEISRGDAYDWCADSYKYTGEKLKELKKKKYKIRFKDYELIIWRYYYGEIYTRYGFRYNVVE